jgi:hypothetical protein
LVLGTVAGVVLGAKAIQGRTFNAAGIESVT